MQKFYCKQTTRRFVDCPAFTTESIASDSNPSRMSILFISRQLAEHGGRNCLRECLQRYFGTSCVSSTSVTGKTTRSLECMCIQTKLASRSQRFPGSWHVGQSRLEFVGRLVMQPLTKECKVRIGYRHRLRILCSVIRLLATSST